MSSGGTAIGGKEPASTRLFLAVVASAVFTTVLTGTMINVVIPLMRIEFGASTAQVGWVITELANNRLTPACNRLREFEA